MAGQLAVQPSSQSSTYVLYRKNLDGWARQRGVRATVCELTDEDRQELFEAFQALTEDYTGNHASELTYKELIKAADVVLGPGNYNVNTLKSALMEMDLNKNGKITWFEFRAYMSSNWNASKTAQDIVNQGHQEDMITVDTLRFVDLIKHYRRRMIMDHMLSGKAQLRFGKFKASHFDAQHGPGPAGNGDGAPSLRPTQRRASITFQQSPGQLQAGDGGGGGGGAEVDGRLGSMSFSRHLAGHGAPASTSMHRKAITGAGAERQRRGSQADGGGAAPGAGADRQRRGSQADGPPTEQRHHVMVDDEELDLADDSYEVGFGGPSLYELCLGGTTLASELHSKSQGQVSSDFPLSPADELLERGDTPRLPGHELPPLASPLPAAAAGGRRSSGFGLGSAEGLAGEAMGGRSAFSEWRGQQQNSDGTTKGRRSGQFGDQAPASVPLSPHVYGRSESPVPSAFASQHAPLPPDSPLSPHQHQLQRRRTGGASNGVLKRRGSALWQSADVASAPTSAPTSAPLGAASISGTLPGEADHAITSPGNVSEGHQGYLATSRNPTASNMATAGAPAPAPASRKTTSGLNESGHMRPMAVPTSRSGNLGMASRGSTDLSHVGSIVQSSSIGQGHGHNGMAPPASPPYLSPPYSPGASPQQLPELPSPSLPKLPPLAPMPQQSFVSTVLDKVSSLFSSPTKQQTASKPVSLPPMNSWHANTSSSAATTDHPTGATGLSRRPSVRAIASGPAPGAESMRSTTHRTGTGGAGAAALGSKGTVLQHSKSVGLAPTGAAGGAVAGFPVFGHLGRGARAGAL